MNAFKNRGAEKGTALVEAAIALPLVLLLILGLAELSLLFLGQQDVTYAARSAVRVLAVEDGTGAQARAEASDRLGTKAKDATITVTEPDPANPADCDVRVRIDVPAASIKPVNFFGFYSGDISAVVTMRKEDC